jgi:AcrR family transcriptional regulator
LINAAATLFHHTGVERTTIAEIAGAADVPLGNVYYYFKTKDDLIEAVVSSRVSDLLLGTKVLDEGSQSPATRLKAWFRGVSGEAESIAQFGCPYGTLSTELEKRARGKDRHAAHLLQAPTDWAETQFREMGRVDAPDLAIQLLAAYQGTAVLAHVFGRPELLARETQRVENWIDSLQP